MADEKKELPEGKAENLKEKISQAEKGTELSENELDTISGGLKKLPGKTKPSTVLLKRGKNSSMDL